MRITGGEWRSRRLGGPGKRKGLRPTPDSMRERAFAVIGDRVVNARVLDLYAGTGAIGLEALSRGAAAVVFVERDRKAALLIRKNIDSFDLGADRAELIVRPAASAIAALAQRDATFDFAWADPPFDAWREGLEVTEALFERGVLGPRSLAFLECPAKARVSEYLPKKLEIVRDLTGSASRVVMITSR